MAQLFTNFWCSFGRSIVEIKRDTCNNWVNLKKLQKTVFFLSRILWLQVVTSSNQVVSFLLQRGFASVPIAAPKSTCSFQLSFYYLSSLVALGDNRCVCGSCGDGGAQHLLWSRLTENSNAPVIPEGEVSEGFKWLVHCLNRISTSSSIINTNLSTVIASLPSTQSL